MLIVIPVKLVVILLLPLLLVVGVFIALGPGFFWHLLWFQKRERQRLAPYVHSGISITGIIHKVECVDATETRSRQEERHRRQVEREGLPRNWEVHYAYQLLMEEDAAAAAEDATSMVVVKGSIQLTTDQLKENGRDRLIPLKILPGQPDSAVPQIFVPTELPTETDPAEVCVMYVCALFCTAILTALVSFGVSAFQSDPNFIIVVSVTLATVLVLGLAGAAVWEGASQSKVPGNVLTKHSVAQDSFSYSEEDVASWLNADGDPSTWKALTPVEIAGALGHGRAYGVPKEEHDDTEDSTTHEESSLELSTSLV